MRKKGTKAFFLSTHLDFSEVIEPDSGADDADKEDDGQDDDGHNDGDVEPLIRGGINNLLEQSQHPEMMASALGVGLVRGEQLATAFSPAVVTLVPVNAGWIGDVGRGQMLKGHLQWLR